MVRSPAATTRPSVRLRDGVPIRLLQLALFLLLVAFTAAIRPTAAQRPPLGRSKSIVQPRRNQVYVQLSAPPLAKAAANAGVDHVRAFSPDATHSNPVIAQAAQRIRLDKERFLEECKAANISVIVDSTFSTIANLISVRVSSPNHIDALRRLPGVLKVFPSLSGPLPKSSPVKSKPISIADARALFTTPQQQPRLRRRDGNDNPNLETTDWHVKSLHNMTRLTDAREADPSLTGKGIKVGVISSGIDWQHEAFVREGQSCEQWGDAGCRVTHGWACKVNQDAPPTDGGPVKPALEEGEDVGGLAPPPRRTPPLPPSFKTENVTCVSAEESAGEAIRDSCVGIGTSIASVVGGQWNGAVNGVAPEVTFGAYNIRPCTAASNESSAESFYYTTKLFLSILEHAIHDKMDVLMIEPTFRYGYHTQDTVESFVINAVSEWYNIPVVVPAGELRQEESKGTPHRIESPSHANGALTVTSVTSPVQPFDSINVTVGIPRGGGLPIRRRLRVLGALNPGSVRDDTPVFEKDRWYRLATSPHPPTVDDDGCPQGNHTWPASFFAGHIAVVRYAEKKCSLEQLFDAAGDARAVGVVFYTEYATLPREITTAWHSLRVPGLMLNKADGEWLRATVAANYNVTDPRDIPRARLRMNKRMWLRAAANVTVPAYNRWGPSMDLAIKPDLGCVGEHLVVAASTSVMRKPSLAIMHGTRMAAGYIAGLVALMRQQNPTMSARAIMDRVRNAGRPLAELLETVMVADSVIKQGAGAMVDACSLLVPSIAVTPSKLELGDVPGFPIEGKFTPFRVVNVTMRNVGRTVEHVRVTGLFAEGVRWGTAGEPWDRYMTPQTGISPSSIRLQPGEQVEISLHMDFSRVAAYARTRWSGGGGGGGGEPKPGYGKRPKPIEPSPASPAYGKRRPKSTRLVRRDGEPVDGEPVEGDGIEDSEPIPVPDLDRMDKFPTTDMAPNTPPMFMLSGYISFASANSTNILASVPYFLFAGEYRGGAYFMPPGEPGSPYLYSEYRVGQDRRDWRFHLHLPGKHVPIFNLTTRGTTPRIGFGLYQPVRKLQLDVIDANTKALLGGIATGHFRAASQGSNLAYIYPSEEVGAIWDGKLQPPDGHKGPPPRLVNGTYMFRVSLYKFAPLTDPKRGETPIEWTSPPFVVRYNATSDVFGPGGPPAEAVMPWDQPPPEDGANTNPGPDPAEPTKGPVPTDTSTPSEPSPLEPSPTISDATSTPTPDPIGVIIIPGTNSSTSEAAIPSHRLFRRDGNPRRGSSTASTSTAPTIRPASRRETKRMYILGEWTYSVETRSSGHFGDDLVLPWDHVVLGADDQDDGPSLPSPPAREEGEELELEDLPEFVRDEMDQYPGQPTVIGKTRVRVRVPGDSSTRRYRKKCIIRKKADHV